MGERGGRRRAGHLAMARLLLLLLVLLEHLHLLQLGGSHPAHPTHPLHSLHPASHPLHTLHAHPLHPASASGHLRLHHPLHLECLHPRVGLLKLLHLGGGEAAEIWWKPSLTRGRVGIWRRWRLLGHAVARHVRKLRGTACGGCH